jgi:hypothetical protein
LKAIGIVHFKKRGSRATDFSDTDNSNSNERKMIVPIIDSGIE